MHIILKEQTWGISDTESCPRKLGESIWYEDNADTHIQIVTVNSGSNPTFFLGRKLLFGKLQDQRFSANLIGTAISNIVLFIDPRNRIKRWFNKRSLDTSEKWSILSLRQGKLSISCTRKQMISQRFTGSFQNHRPEGPERWLQQLRVLMALSKNRSLIPSTHLAALIMIC